MVANPDVVFGCRLLKKGAEEDGCPDGFDSPAWCTRCNGRDDLHVSFDKTIEYTWAAEYESPLDCGHVPGIGEICARMESGRSKCSLCAKGSSWSLPWD